MAGTTAIASTTIGLASLPNSITAQGNGVYDIVSNSTPYINITVGFVYSTSTMVVSANSPSGGLDTGSLISGIGISEIATPNLYPGGPSVAPFTSTDINVDYTLSITGILPNTNYNVRSYIKYYGSAGEGPFYKYGSQLSILSSSGVPGGSGYYISNDTVGFYDPLQIRDADEGIEKVLTTDSSGLATWKSVKSLFTFGHYIGERYGGGIVAAVWKEGDDEKVLIVSESDITVDTPTGSSLSPAWSYGTAQTTLIGSPASSKYNGYLNTAAIVAQSVSLGTTYSAAAGAAAYRGGGFEDWYLPSYYEFNQVFNNMAIINKVLNRETFDAGLTYWTSTEYGANRAGVFPSWGNNNVNSTFTIASKSTAGKTAVRAVRKESVYTGDGLIFNLDATNKKSFSDIDYINLGTASRWSCLVNRGMSSSYAFLPSYHPRTAAAGYQPTGPVYLAQESGFIRFNGTGSLIDDLNTFGSYFDVNVPVGNATIVTVEMWMRMVPGYETRMPFGWGKYDIFTGAGGGLGFNTGNSDLFGLSPTQFRALGTIGNWAHYVFEMNSTLSYTNNKIYINGNEQTLSQIAGVELSGNRNFNGGLGRVGGWRSADNNQFYLFRGDISVVRIYSRALTKDEIMANYGKEKKRYDIQPSLLKNNLFASIDFDDTTSFSGDGTLSREVVDISGNARNAMMTISQTTQVPAVIRTGSLYSGRELVFPGTIAANPVLEWADSVAIRSITSISVSFWIKLSEHRTSEIIVKWDSTNQTRGSWEVYQYSPSSLLSNIAFRLKDSSQQEYTFFGTKSIPIDEWVHVCATYNNSSKSVKTYINSSIDIASSVPQSFSLATGVVGQISVGRYVTAASLYYPLVGSIANIQIYDKSLSVGEIKNNYDAGKFKFEYSFADSNKYFSHEINGNPTFSISQNLVLDIGGSSNQKILKLNNLGYAKWVDKSSLFSRPTNYRYIGELYGGGIIVAMWYYPKTVFNYLIMSIEDVSAASQWSNVTSIAPTATSMHKGESNTAAIIAQASHTTSAAKLCDDYAGGGFTDWYLPSVFEMNHAFNAASIVDTVLGSDALVGVYWTSTEYSPQSGVSTSAYCYSFTESDMPYGNTGIQKIQAKSTSNKVRAFRLATNAVSVNNWDNTWDETYTPWWRRSFDSALFWEADFLPARYEPVAFDYWDITTVTTGTIANVSGDAIVGNGTKVYSITNSSVSTFERVIEFGVCWIGSSPETAMADPTTSDNKVIGTGNYSSFNSTISWTTNFSVWSDLIYVRAYAITRSGTYYGARRNYGYGRS